MRTALEPAQRALLSFAFLVCLGACGARAGSATLVGCADQTSVVATRDRRPDDVPAIRRLRYTAATDPRSIPGPDSLRLIDTDDAEHHPRVFIEDLRTGRREDIVGTSASRPSWSPDGRYIACVIYVSQEQPYQLAIIDRHSRRRIDIDARLATDEYRWSPNSRWIAVAGVERATNRVGLSIYDLARGRLRRLSTTSAFGSYGLSWSPDSKLLAFTEPSEVDEEETVLAADLWVAPTSSWSPCRLRTTPDEIESQPEWVTDTELLVKTVPRTAPHTTGRELVLGLHQKGWRSP